MTTGDEQQQEKRHLVVSMKPDGHPPTSTYHAIPPTPPNNAADEDVPKTNVPIPLMAVWYSVNMYSDHVHFVDR